MAQKYPNSPPESQTKDNYTHHSSPTPDDEQQAPPMMPRPTASVASTPGGKTIRKTDVPMHVTKHPEPVGRPKSRNEY